MNRKRALWLGIGFVTLAIAGWFTLSLPRVQDELLARGIASELVYSRMRFPERDELSVVLCGTAAPPPSEQRAKACTLVMAGKHAFVVDTGPGSANHLSSWRFPFERLDGILLTHFHSDHIGDLGEFRMQSWVAGRSSPLPVYGPAGVQELVHGTNLLYAADTRVRGTEHHLDIVTADLEARPFGLASQAERATHMGSNVIYNQDGLRITAFQVVHEPVYPAVGYRFDYRGRSVVISGDTAVSANLVRVASGADLLVHEAQSEVIRAVFERALRADGNLRMANVIGQIGNYHATPVQVAQEANQAGVRLLVYSHMGPLAADNMLIRRIFVRDVADVRPASRWILGMDGMIFGLPAGSEQVTTDSIR